MSPPRFAPLMAPIGFYPVMPDVDWVQRVLQWGARTVQLRFKSMPHDEAVIAEQVHTAVVAGRAVPGAQVFINDHWRHALAAGAYGVHLGQEDWAALTDTERATLRASGMRLGLSTHTPEELALAHAAAPSYLAIGPVYPTTLKAMPYEPVGLERLQQWMRTVPECPVVAIGGIAWEQMDAVMQCGVNGIAVVSAVTQAPDPQRAVLAGVECVESTLRRKSAYRFF